MKLITEIIKSKLVEEKENYGWNTYTHHMLHDLIKLCNELKSQELQNIEAAFRTGWQTTDRWSLNLEIYDHIKSRYDEETMTYDQYHEEKKSAEFFKKNFSDFTEQELQDCNCGLTGRCNCHIADADNSSPKESDN